MVSEEVMSMSVLLQLGCSTELSVVLLFFFQAEDGIREAQESRWLGDVYKRQVRG